MKIPIMGIPDVSQLDYDIDNPTRLTEELSKAILVNLRAAQDGNLAFNFESTFEGIETYDKWAMVRAYMQSLYDWKETEEHPEPPPAPMLDDMLSLGMTTENLQWIFSAETFCLFLRQMAKAGLPAVLKKALLTKDEKESLMYLLQRFPQHVSLGYNEIDYEISETTAKP